MQGILVLLKEMCHVCYELGVKLTLTDVENTIQNPTGVVQIPLCDKCSN